MIFFCQTSPFDLFFAVCCNSPTSLPTRPISRLVLSRRHLQFGKSFSRWHRVRNKLSTAREPFRAMESSAKRKVPDVTLESTNHALTASVAMTAVSDLRTGNTDSLITSGKTSHIWRLVDDHMDQSIPDDSDEKCAQIFSRSADEVLYSPRFFSTEKQASILDPSVGFPVSKSHSKIAGPISPTPFYPHVQRRHLLSGSGAVAHSPDITIDSD